MMKVEGLSNMEIIRFVGNDGIIHGDTCSPVGKQICRMVINETSRYLLVDWISRPWKFYLSQLKKKGISHDHHDDPGWPFSWESKKNIKQLRINCCPNCWDFFVGGFASPQLTSVRKCGYSPFNSHLSRENHGRPWDGYTSSSNRVIWATNLSLAERCSMLPPLFMLGAGYGSMANETATISYVV